MSKAAPKVPTAAEVAPPAPPAPVVAAAAVAADFAAPVAMPSSAKFDLEDNIAFPTRRAGPNGGESAYPFKHMAIGQSFFVPATDRMEKPWLTLTSLASRIGRELHPKSFTTARDTKDGKDGVRIWRKADATGELKPVKVIGKRKAKAEGGAQSEAERLAAEAVEGDTSQRKHPTPDFVDGGTPPAPGAPPPPPPAS